MKPARLHLSNLCMMVGNARILYQHIAVVGATYGGKTDNRNHDLLLIFESKNQGGHEVAEKKEMGWKEAHFPPHQDGTQGVGRFSVRADRVSVRQAQLDLECQ